MPAPEISQCRDSSAAFILSLPLIPESCFFASSLPVSSAPAPLISSRVFLCYRKPYLCSPTSFLSWSNKSFGCYMMLLRAGS